MIDAGEKLTRTMAERGVSIRQLASRSGMSLNTIRRLRRHQTAGNLYTWAIIAETLGIELSELFKAGDNECK